MDLKTRVLSSYWITIWTNPRETIKKFSNNISESLSALLFILGHISTLIYIFYYDGILNLKDNYLEDLANLFLAGTLWGIYELYINNRLIAIFGKKLRGKASFKQIKQSLALSQIPLIYGLILDMFKILVQVISFKYFDFKINGLDPFDPTDSNVFSSLFFTFCVIIDCFILFKSPVIYLKCLSQVQGFPESEGLVSAIKNTSYYLLGIPLLLILAKFFL